MLDQLPSELLLQIADHVGHQRDLKHLCDTSKSLYKVLLPRLYESITITTAELSFKELEAKLTSIPLEPLQFTKHVKLRAPFHGLLTNRCPHMGYSGSDGGRPRFPPLENALGRVLSRIPKNQLRSFIWDLGTCLTDRILKMLTKRQTSLSNLSLTTDPQCGDHGPTCYDVEVEKFKSLRSISWTGINGIPPTVCLHNGLRANAQHLESLYIDLVEGLYLTEKEGMSGNPDMFDPIVVLFWYPVPEERFRLSCLNSVTLVSVSFHVEYEWMCEVLNLSKLSHLKLIRCNRAEQIIYQATKLELPMQLKSFEFVMTSEPTEDDEFNETVSQALSLFLGSFHGLMDLTLVLLDPNDWEIIFKGIKQHHTSLKRLITNALTEIPLEIFENFDIEWSTAQKDLFESCKLEFLGQGLVSNQNIKELESLSSKPSCEMLHVRSNRGPNDITTTWLNKPVRTKNHYLDLSELKVSASDPPSKWDIGRSQSPRPPLQLKNGRGRVDCKYPYGDIRNLARCDPEHFKDIIAQAEWAFGPHGFPGLKVMAYGDFSHDGRFGQDNLLLCKDEKSSSIRALKDDGDEDLWRIVRKHLDMLSAGPVSARMMINDDEFDDGDDSDDDDDDDDDTDDY